VEEIPREERGGEEGSANTLRIVSTILGLKEVGGNPSEASSNLAKSKGRGLGADSLGGACDFMGRRDQATRCSQVPWKKKGLHEAGISSLTIH